MSIECSSYREFLKQVLAERQSRNPNYSLRAFAKALRMAPSTLSDVFSGRRNLSARKLFEIAQRLGLSHDEAQYLQLLGQYEGASAEDTRAWIEDQLRSRAQRGRTCDLTMEQFKLISVWYHYAIHELMDLDGFELSAASAAGRLGITEQEASAAICVLAQLGLIQADETGKWVRNHDQLRVSSLIAVPALRQFYRQMLEKTAVALNDQAPRERTSGSQTLAFDKEQYGEMQALMSDFLDRAAAIAAKGKRKTEVYHLCTHFFKLTQDRTASQEKTP